MTELKTVSVAPDGAEKPYWTICKGHVDVITFNIAFRKEGWRVSTVIASQLTHEWWVEKGGWWKKATNKNKESQPVTIVEW